MTDRLPSQARVVVVGGGIAGCSVAYHLTKLGWRDVLLLERRDLSCGTTWHAAGLVGQLRATQNLTRLAKYGADLYERLEAETGQATGFRRPGSVSVARTAERMHELERLASMARCFGVEVEVIAPAEAGRRWPLMRTDDLVGGLWLPRDGRTNPIDTTLALAKGARRAARRSLENTAVDGDPRRGGAVAGVAHHARRRRVRGRRELRGDVGARARAAGRRGRAAARLRALLHRHRTHAGRAAGPARAA